MISRHPLRPLMMSSTVRTSRPVGLLFGCLDSRCRRAPLLELLGVKMCVCLVACEVSFSVGESLFVFAACRATSPKPDYPGGDEPTPSLVQAELCVLDGRDKPKPLRFMRNSAGRLRDISGWLSQCHKHQKRCTSQWILALSIVGLFD